jgi:hypothetical protein
MNQLSSLDYIVLLKNHTNYSIFISYTKQDVILRNLSTKKIDLLYDFYYTLSINKNKYDIENIMINKNNRFDMIKRAKLDNIYSYIFDVYYNNDHLDDLIKIFKDDLKVDINHKNIYGNNFLVEDIKYMLSVEKQTYLYYLSNKMDNTYRYIKIFLENNLDVNQTNKDGNDLIYYVKLLDEKYDSNYLELVCSYDSSYFIKSAID